MLKKAGIAFVNVIPREFFSFVGCAFVKSTIGLNCLLISFGLQNIKMIIIDQ